MRIARVLVGFILVSPEFAGAMDLEARLSALEAERGAIQAKVARLEARVEAIESGAVELPSVWSCGALCAAPYSFSGAMKPVSGVGATAAQAFQAMARQCDSSGLVLAAGGTFRAPIPATIPAVCTRN